MASPLDSIEQIVPPQSAGTSQASVPQQTPATNTNTMYMQDYGCAGYKGAYQISLKGLWDCDNSEGNNIDNVVSLLLYCKDSQQYRNDNHLILAFLGSKNCLNKLVHLTEAQLNNLDEFLAWLRAYTRVDESYYRNKLKTLKQNKINFRTYFYDLVETYRKGHFKPKDTALSKSDKEAIIEKFILGVSDPRVKQQLAMMPENQITFDETGTSIVCRAEYIAQQLRNLYNDNDKQEAGLATADPVQIAAAVIPHEMQAMQKTLVELTTAMNSLLSKKEDQPSERKVAFEPSHYANVTCYNCKGRGHYSRDCRSSEKFRRENFRRYNNRNRRYDNGYRSRSRGRQYDNRDRGNYGNRGYSRDHRDSRDRRYDNRDRSNSRRRNYNSYQSRSRDRNDRRSNSRSRYNSGDYQSRKTSFNIECNHRPPCRNPRDCMDREQGREQGNQ